MLANVASPAGLRELRRGARERARRCRQAPRAFLRMQCSESPPPCNFRFPAARGHLPSASEILLRASRRFAARLFADFAPGCSIRVRTTASALLLAAHSRVRERPGSVQEIVRSMESRPQHAFVAA